MIFVLSCSFWDRECPASVLFLPDRAQRRWGIKARQDFAAASCVQGAAACPVAACLFAILQEWWYIMEISIRMKG